MRALLMVAGVIMIIAVLGTAGYIFVKGPDSKALKLGEASSSKVATARGGAETNGKVTAVVHEASKKGKPAPAKRPKNKAKHAAKKKKGSKKGAHRSTAANRAGEKHSEHSEEGHGKQETSLVQAAGRVLSNHSGPVIAKTAQVDDDDAIQSTQKDARSEKLLFETEPECSLGQDIYRCDESEQAEMMRSYLCLGKSDGRTCLEWRPQRQCLAAPSNRFTSSSECEHACKEAGRCGRAQSCDCTGLFRKANYVFDSVRKRCRLIPRIECVDKDVGFNDSHSCKDACEKGGGREDTRCGLGSLENLVRPCLWEDKVYTHYYDHKNKRCEPWDETACVSDAFTRLAECLRTCVGPGLTRKRQVASAVGGNSTAPPQH